MGEVRVLFFAGARQLAGRAEWDLALVAPIDESMLWEKLIDSFPELARIRPSVRLARNQSYLAEGERIEPGDEIALIPPVSGG